MTKETKAKISQARKKLFAEGKITNWHKKHAREKSPYWKGGKHITKGGYVRVRIGTESDLKTVYEHRLVMERILGRALESYEHVHHLNGVRHDNRPENLVVLHIRDHMKVHRECPACGFSLNK